MVQLELLAFWRQDPPSFIMKCWASVKFSSVAWYHCSSVWKALDLALDHSGSATPDCDRLHFQHKTKWEDSQKVWPCSGVRARWTMLRKYLFYAGPELEYQWPATGLRQSSGFVTKPDNWWQTLWSISHSWQNYGFGRDADRSDQIIVQLEQASDLVPRSHIMQNPLCNWPGGMVRHCTPVSSRTSSSLLSLWSTVLLCDCLAQSLVEKTQ